VVQFTATILKFGEQGEKTGWTYIQIPAEIALRLKPANKKSFRVKGKLDELPISGVALLPMGDGHFIMPLNATTRKKIQKRKGATLKVQLEVDNKPVALSKELMDCLADEPEALAYFNSLPGSHRLYFSNWIQAAKTDPTKIRRVALVMNALSKKWNFGQMVRSAAQQKWKPGLDKRF
jgi:hypothetical protein